MDPWTTLYSAHGIPTIHAVPFWLNQTQQTTTNWGKGVNQTWPIRDYPSGVGGFNWDQGGNAPLPQTCPRPNKFQERPSGTSRIQETFSGHRWGAYSAALDPLAGGWRLAFLPQEPHPGCRPVGHLASGLNPRPPYSLPEITSQRDGLDPPLYPVESWCVIWRNSLSRLLIRKYSVVYSRRNCTVQLYN